MVGDPPYIDTPDVTLAAVSVYVPGVRFCSVVLDVMYEVPLKAGHFGLVVDDKEAVHRVLDHDDRDPQ